MIKKLFVRLLEFFGIIKKVETNNTTTDSVVVEEKKEEVIVSTEDSNVVVTKDEDSTDVTVKVEEATEDDDSWFEYVAFDESTIEKIKDVFRPIVKKYYSGEGQNTYFEFMEGLIKHIKVYCTISDEGKLLSIRFSMSNAYIATDAFGAFINQYILKDFYAKIQDTALADIPLEINLENGVLKIRLVKFLNDTEE